MAQSVRKVQGMILSFLELKSKDGLLCLLQGCDSIVEIKITTTNSRAQTNCAEEASSYIRALVQCKNLEKIQMVFNGQAAGDSNKRDLVKILSEAKGLFRAHPLRPNIDIQLQC